MNTTATPRTSHLLKISDAASIGLHAMIVIASDKDGGFLTVKDIAKNLDVSANHLSKVLQRLVKEELVVSIKGNKGGFRLAKAPDDTTFLEIYEAIDGKLRPSPCLLNKAVCIHTCIMGGLTQSINRQVETFFRNTKLADFIG